MMIRGQIKLNGWDEVRGITSVQEDFGTIAEQIAADQAQAQGIQPGQEYLKNAEMQMEDDYNSIDGIINNGSKKDIEEEQQKASVKEKLHEYDTKLKKELSEQPKAPDRQKLCQCFCPEHGVDI